MYGLNSLFECSGVSPVLKVSVWMLLMDTGGEY